jgi:hypothetical protein
MKSQPRYVRIFGECHDGQWTLMCLDFSLAVQDESLTVAKAKLRSQVAAYVKDATDGVDKEHRDYLLSRTAPLRYWVKFYFFGAIQRVRHHRNQKARAHIASRRPMESILASA